MTWGFATTGAGGGARGFAFGAAGASVDESLEPGMNILSCRG